jgi:hypothetical protein
VDFEGADPIGLELLARATEQTGAELRVMAIDIAAALDDGGVTSDVPGRLRAMAATLEAESTDQRARRRQLVDDPALLGMLIAGGGVAGYNGFDGQDVIDDLLRGYHDVWDGNHDQTVPFGQLFMGAKTLWNRVAWLAAGGGEVPSLLDSKVGQWAIKLAPWLDSPVVDEVSTTFGVVGGLYQGVKGTIGLVQAGNPVDAFHRDGAKYVAKVAGTALGYSSAAFVACPNPVTGGAVIVSGSVWLGAEAWEHAGQISQGVVTAAHAVDTAWDASVGAVGSALTATSGALDDLTGGWL